MRSPFRYEEPVAREDLVDRLDELEFLRDRALDGRNSRLEAPRRFGKTSLLRAALATVADDGAVAIEVNFLGCVTAADVAQRIERAYAAQLDARHGARIESRGEIEVLWDSSTGLERRALKLIADRTVPLSGREADIRFGLSKGSSVQAAVDRLIAEGHLVRDAGTRTGWRVVDPFLESWLREPETWA